jgi:hypothetical protein
MKVAHKYKIQVFVFIKLIIYFLYKNEYSSSKLKNLMI